MSEPLQAFNLVFFRPTQDKQAIASVILGRMNVRRLIFLNTGCNEKHTYDSAILVVNADGDLSLLSQPVTEIGGIGLKVHKISLEEAEWAIDQKRTKIYVGNIPYPTDNETLWKHFAKYGTLDYTYIVKKPTKSGQKGFGYVIYKDRASLEHALSIKHFLQGVRLNCKIFLNKGKLKRRSGDEGEETEEGYQSENLKPCRHAPKSQNQQDCRHHHHHVIPAQSQPKIALDRKLEDELYFDDESQDHIGGSSDNFQQYDYSSTPKTSVNYSSKPDKSGQESCTIASSRVRKPLKLANNSSTVTFTPNLAPEAQSSQYCPLHTVKFAANNHAHHHHEHNYHYDCFHAHHSASEAVHHHHHHSQHHHIHSHHHHEQHDSHSQHHHSHCAEHRQQHQAHLVHAHHVLIPQNKPTLPPPEQADDKSLDAQSFDESLAAFDGHRPADESAEQSDMCSEDHCEDLLCLGELCGFNDPKLALEEHIKRWGALRPYACAPAQHEHECHKDQPTCSEEESMPCCDDACPPECCAEPVCQTMYQACELDEKGRCDVQQQLKSMLADPPKPVKLAGQLLKEEPTVICCWDSHEDEPHCDKHDKCTATGGAHVGCIGQPCTINNCSFGPRMREIKRKHAADRNKTVVTGRFRSEYKPL